MPISTSKHTLINIKKTLAKRNVCVGFSCYLYETGTLVSIALHILGTEFCLPPQNSNKEQARTTRVPSIQHHTNAIYTRKYCGEKKIHVDHLPQEVL